MKQRVKNGDGKQVMVMSRIGWVSSNGCRNDFERVAKRSRDKKRYGHFFRDTI